MQRSKSAKHRFDRIAFLSSGSPEANAAQAHFVARFGAIDPESADVVVALGGDGLMLQTLHRFMGKNKPIYGMKQGSLGFLMNEFHGPDLKKRLDQAEASIVHPLQMEATGIQGESIKARAVNEVSILRQSYQ
ncbi:MAG: NAD(+)/NADH kinase, partial [Methylocella sp.]